MTARPLVYVCSRLRESEHRTMSDNLRRVRALCLAAVKAHVAPFAPHLFFTEFLDEWNAAERAAGIECGLAWLDSVDEVWVDTRFGVSAGMRGEIDYAEKLGKRVVFDPPCWKEIEL